MSIIYYSSNYITNELLEALIQIAFEIDFGNCFFNELLKYCSWKRESHYSEPKVTKKNLKFNLKGWMISTFNKTNFWVPILTGCLFRTSLSICGHVNCSKTKVFYCDYRLAFNPQIITYCLSQLDKSVI